MIEFTSKAIHQQDAKFPMIPEVQKKMVMIIFLKMFLVCLLILI